MSEEKIEFQAEVAKVLDIVIHSLYSNSEIFLRELISNASDACDKLRYALLIHPELAKKNNPFQIGIRLDKSARTLTIEDNGIGMNKDDLINHLGTIARSGSSEFMKNLTGDKQKDMALIGQFGVGFYASFMVADRVVVFSKKAGDSLGWRWESDGTGTFTIQEDKTIESGTKIVLHMKEGMDDYLEPIRIRHLVKQYSDHISWPIMLKEGKGEERLNAASALWTRNKAEITDSQYKDFYQSVSHAFDAPWMTLHYKAEGIIDYTALMFIPTKAPFNLFQADRKMGIQLYTNKVFITDDMPEIMPYYLRFVTGVIDTNDLPLNVSREMLQKTPVMSKIKNGIVHRILEELKKKVADKEAYQIFWDSFGIVFKEGLYEPIDNREEVAELCRFHSTLGTDLVGFSDYVSRMKKGQENIYYLTGTDLESLKVHPQLEGFAERGIEVLLLTDPIDEFWVQTYTEYRGKKIVSVMHAREDLDKIESAEKDNRVAISPEDSQLLIQKMTAILGKSVSKIQMTDRLTKSPMALITPEGQMSMNLERLMRANGQTIRFDSDRILELNSKHPIMAKLVEQCRLNGSGESTDKNESGESHGAGSALADIVWILYGEALMSAGERVENPAEMTDRLNRLIMKGLA